MSPWSTFWHLPRPVILIISVTIGLFVLLIIAILKYCVKLASSRRVENNQPSNEEIEEEEDNALDLLRHELRSARTNGLDEALIRSITTVKYNKEDGLIGVTNCSICLGEFLEGENLRLLPNCSHAFHVNCIETWLKSHSNCPLCRAKIVSIFMPHPSGLSPPRDHASV